MRSGSLRVSGTGGHRGLRATHCFERTTGEVRKVVMHPTTLVVVKPSRNLTALMTGELFTAGHKEGHCGGIRVAGDSSAKVPTLLWCEQRQVPGTLTSRPEFSSCKSSKNRKGRTADAQAPQRAPQGLPRSRHRGRIFPRGRS